MRTRRNGFAAVWALIVLAAITMISAATIGQFAAARRQLESHHNRLQTDWLIRSGQELAIAGILADPNGYTGETVTPIPRGQIKIAVKKDPEKDDVYRIEIEARYPNGERGMVVRTMPRSLKKVNGPNGIRLEPIVE